MQKFTAKSIYDIIRIYKLAMKKNKIYNDIQ